MRLKDTVSLKKLLKSFSSLLASAQMNNHANKLTLWYQAPAAIHPCFNGELSAPARLRVDSCDHDKFPENSPLSY